jgi:hypothetical protein
MKLKELEKATGMLQDIKILDNEIIEIEKMAMLIANNDTESMFTLQVWDKDKEHEEKNKVSFDEDGSLQSRGSFADYLMSGMLPFVAPKFDKNEHVSTIKYDLSVNASMQILGVLLWEKQNKRQSLIQKLNKYGINI